MPDWGNVTAVYRGQKEIDRVYLGQELVWEKQSGAGAYLTFSSPNSFTLGVYNATKNWDGTLESSTDGQIWTVWDGTTTLTAAASGGAYYLYMRGNGNTKITGVKSNYRWVLTGSEIACGGDIRALLDHANLGEAVMGANCYQFMFINCTALTEAPRLPATTLAESCYASMFSGCTSLVSAPVLPATALASDCYVGMFDGCTALTEAPALPATTLAESCYASMFYGCTSLVSAPALPANTLAKYCYTSMFYGCTSLVSAPVLSATTAEAGCYQSMFRNCTALTEAPALPATALAFACYASMFYGCTGIKLSETQTGEYQIAYRIPESGMGTTETKALDNMFVGTGGTFKETPAINTTYYTVAPAVAPT